MAGSKIEREKEQRLDVWERKKKSHFHQTFWSTPSQREGGCQSLRLHGFGDARPRVMRVGWHRPQEGGRGRRRRRKETLIHAVALRSQSGEGVSVCFTPELANFCDGTFICGIQNDTVMRFCDSVCLLGFLCLFSLPWHLIFRRNQILHANINRM